MLELSPLAANVVLVCCFLVVSTGMSFRWFSNNRTVQYLGLAISSW